MVICYKIEGTKVCRDEFVSNVSTPDLLVKWENAIAKYREDIEQAHCRIIMSSRNRKFHVHTDTDVLLKLHIEVYKNMVIAPRQELLHH